MIIGIIAGFVIGFVVACITIYILQERNRKRRKEKKKRVSLNTYPKVATTAVVVHGMILTTFSVFQYPLTVPLLEKTAQHTKPLMTRL